MAILKIITVPNIVLRKKAADVAKVSERERKILSDMAETMYINGGVGLAATQVGIDKRAAVIDIGTGGILKVINPYIVKREGAETREEGCLSVPEACVKVKRAKRIVLDFLDENGQPRRLTAQGLLARVIQHEVDHLSGRLIIDYLNPLKKLFLNNKKRLSGLTKA